MAKGWYVLHVYSGYEKRVEEAVNELIQEKSLEGILFQIKVPVRDVSEMKNGKKKVSKQKLFPGYVLLEMDLDKQHWKEVYSLIKNIQGVTGFVGANKQKKPISIMPEEARVMLQSMSEAKTDVFTKQKYDFRHGETVKITDGPFSTFTGVIEEINREKNKLKVMVGIFGRSTPVELDFTQVEKI
ncbi:MAG: transcription termination/antitermination factor NusG [Spirochaetes bacterium GWD1_27_9]|nr:MAG: transcription termination/antitermination factor NusG [Spirochaetes bacterium GWB1_27_13]OHD21009.1 MAG: transcription termination/antitermination factor NusG [Spirochaetes bacterium GWC1_27_15]OHD45371.1 MAG: transcription termination/antitermination factor NusG [Spirochaetes bacterium GWD1_27_9]